MDERVQQLIVSATQTKRWALFDGRRWSSGRPDALRCSETPPTRCCPFSRGAAQGVDDAVTLADCLKSAKLQYGRDGP